MRWRSGDIDSPLRRLWAPDRTVLRLLFCKRCRITLMSVLQSSRSFQFVCVNVRELLERTTCARGRCSIGASTPQF